MYDSSHIHGGDLLPFRDLSLFLSQLGGRLSAIDHLHEYAKLGRHNSPGPSKAMYDLAGILHQALSPGPLGLPARPFSLGPIGQPAWPLPTMAAKEAGRGWRVSGC